MDHDHADAIASTKPTLDQWASLYEIAIEMKKLAPWDFLWDSDLITIQLPEREEPIFCSVMGRIGECYGIGVYTGYESLNGYYRLAKADITEENPNVSFLFLQNCLMVYYGDREELEKEDRDVLKALDIRFRGRNQWIYFRQMQTGYIPWFINAEEAELLTKTLQNLHLSCRCLAESKISVDFEGGETLYCEFSKENNQWLTISKPMPSIPIVKRKLVVTDDLMFARLKKQKKTTVQLEFEWTYFPSPIQENKEQRPYFPRMLLLVDKQSGFVFDTRLVDANQEIEHDVIDILNHYIMTNGRPSKIYVRNEEMSSYVDDFCTKLKIQLIEGQGVPAIDDVLTSMFAFFGEDNDDDM